MRMTEEERDRRRALDREQQRVRYAANPEPVQAAERTYRAEHRDEVNARKRVRYAARKVAS